MLSQTHKIVEALLFVAQEPLTEKQVELAMEEEVGLASIVQDLNEFYEEIDSPVWIQAIGDGYLLKTRREYDRWIRRLYQDKGKVRLSKSALETLSIIAYKQPTTRTEIDAIRGVSSFLKTLLEKNLIEIKGRADGPGRPLLYGTTDYFMEYFGLKSMADLPKMREIEELLKEKEYGEENTAEVPEGESGQLFAETEATETEIAESEPEPEQASGQEPEREPGQESGNPAE